MQFHEHDHEQELDFSEDEDEESDWEDENALMSNDQSIEKNAKKRGKKKKNGKKKSKKPFGGPNEDVVFVEFLESDPTYGNYWLQ